MGGDVHILSWGLYLPEEKVSGREEAGALDLPPEVVEGKLGFKSKRVPGRDDGCAAMAARASRLALRRAKVRASEVDLVIYCGSEYKEHVVWSAAAHVQHMIGASNALSFEVYALCAGLPIALDTARSLMDSSGYRTVLVATASREGDLIDYANPRTKWMANFGAGAGAVLLGRRRGKAILGGFSGLTDSRLSMSVLRPAGGSTMPASTESVLRGLHNLDVTDMERMRGVLEEVSLPNFVRTIYGSLRRSGLAEGDISVLCPTLMKRSFHDQLALALGLDPRRAIYLDSIGHMQSVDQIAALDIAARRKLLVRKAVVVLAAAGTGYTWSALTLKWR
jgi:3-oxoacyl-[acyl-carrier-protein] synthase-3